MAIDFKDYAVPGLLACLLHGFVASSPHLFGFTTHGTSNMDVFEPKVLTATLLQFRPPDEPARTLVAPPATPNLIEVPPDSPSDTSLQREAEEEARLQEIKQQELLADLRERAFTDTVSNELQSLYEGELDQESGEYISSIYTAVVSNWSRPPSARNDMEAVVRVELLPSGELNSVAIVTSSGNAAYDRSTLAAVNAVEKFRVPEDSELFEQRFRSFLLRFHAKDLLR